MTLWPGTELGFDRNTTEFVKAEVCSCTGQRYSRSVSKCGASRTNTLEGPDSEEEVAIGGSGNCSEVGEGDKLHI